MNSSPIALRFSSGSVTPGELREEPVGGLHVDQRHAEVAREGLLDLLGLALAVQPVVDEDAGELVPHGAVHEQRRDGSSRRRRRARRGPRRRRPASRIRRDLLVDDVRRRPVGQQPAAVVRGTASSRPGRGACASTSGWNWTREQRRARGSSIAATGIASVVAVTRKPSGRPRSRRRRGSSTPCRSAGRSLQQHARLAARAARCRRTRGRPVAATSPPERLRHQLVPVADAEDRHAELEHAGVDCGRVRARTRSPDRRTG